MFVAAVQKKIACWRFPRKKCQEGKRDEADGRDEQQKQVGEKEVIPKNTCKAQREECYQEKVAAGLTALK